ncbi:MAG TPA: hypothetical protein VIS48_10495 [Candidatus Kryptonia bacterium]
MIAYEFRDGERSVDLNTDPKAYLCERMINIVRPAFAAVACPLHGQEANATIEMNLAKHPLEWEIRKVCCDSFRDEIESAMPFPWTGTPHHLQP